MVRRENYHLFALRGLLTGLGWARLAGVDLLEEDESRARLAAALQVTGLTALPDFTFPARRDARYGISLAQPMYLELWEIGRARLQAAGDEALAEPLDSWLSTLYSVPAPAAEVFDSYLHEAGLPAPRSGRGAISPGGLCSRWRRIRRFQSRDGILPAR